MQQMRPIENPCFIPMLDENVLKLLKKLKTRRDANLKNEEKGLMKKRIVMGCHEVLKYLKSDRLKAVIIARNMNWQEEAKRGLKNFAEIQIICPSKNIPLISASSKRNIGRVLQKFPYISSVGIVDFTGYEAKFDEIVKFWKIDDDYKMYHIDQNTIFA